MSTNEYLRSLNVRFATHLIEGSTEAAGVWDILKEADEDFVPPLSTRNSPRDVALDHQGKSGGHGPIAYYDDMSKQCCITMFAGSICVGFLSYRAGYTIPEIDQYVDAYVSTIIVARKYGGKGIATYLYKSLIEHLRHENSEYTIATRTWHTNNKHISIIKKLDFLLEKQIIDGRGLGIDTVIYALKVKTL